MFNVWHSLHVGDTWEVIEEGFATFENAQDLMSQHHESFTGLDPCASCDCSICQDGSYLHEQWWQSYICVVVEEGKKPIWVGDQVENVLDLSTFEDQA